MTKVPTVQEGGLSLNSTCQSCIYPCPGLRELPLSALNELLEELEVTIKDCSEVLIQELALKDELDYEKVQL